ncbi:MAG: hypothetical protein KC416_10310 [Myxococcales bacterium]|nr:hypothetical protein [Myxococcales bacterium]
MATGAFILSLYALCGVLLLALIGLGATLYFLGERERRRARLPQAPPGDDLDQEPPHL